MQNLGRMSKQFNLEFENLFKDSGTTLTRALKQKLLATKNVDDYENRTVVSARNFLKLKYESQYESLNKDLKIDLIETMYFIGTKTLKFIMDKKAGPIGVDWDIHVSRDSFNTDEDMDKFSEATPSLHKLERKITNTKLGFT
jgi:hypothetical protein